MIVDVSTNSFLSVDYWPMVTVQRRPSKFFDRWRETGRWRAQQRVRPSSDGLDAAVTQLRYQWSRKLHGLKGDGGAKLGDSIRSPSASMRVLDRVCVRTNTTRAAGCMPAGVIDIGKYAMADRSQRAGTNDCSAAHTAALRIRASNSAIRPL